jgi:hypothetical protein
VLVIIFLFHVLVKVIETSSMILDCQLSAIGRALWSLSLARSAWLVFPRCLSCGNFAKLLLDMNTAIPTTPRLLVEAATASGFLPDVQIKDPRGNAITFWRRAAACR